MALKSSFNNDLKREQQLSIFLNQCYVKNLKNYDFERVFDFKEQMKGVDIKLTHKKTKQVHLVDEKAQLDYLNEDLPTFAFEISYKKNGAIKSGWLFDASKTTDFYALVTGIYTDDSGQFMFCKITFVNREKLIAFLENKNITKESLFRAFENSGDKHGKILVKNLDAKREGYLYYSKTNKAESPLNLVLKLDWLIEKGVAKRLV